MDVSQYLEIFIDESSEHLQNLSDCIMTLENEPENKDTINEVFRAAHSLKGMAGTMGFKRMQTLTHDMENVFQEVRSDKIKVDSAMIDLLFECLDALDKYLENIKETSDEGTEDNEIIIKELNDFIAKAQGKELVLIDTAGRMQTNTNLMDEMKKIKRVSKPDLVIFVGDALTGNDATQQAVKFNEAIDIDGVILTKADADSKGGASLSIGYVIKKPIMFLGVGQGYDDIKEYDAEWMLNQLFSEDEGVAIEE